MYVIYSYLRAYSTNTLLGQVSCLGPIRFYKNENHAYLDGILHTFVMISAKTCSVIMSRTRKSHNEINETLTAYSPTAEDSGEWPIKRGPGCVNANVCSYENPLFRALRSNVFPRTQSRREYFRRRRACTKDVPTLQHRSIPFRTGRVAAANTMTNDSFAHIGLYVYM